jgi:putative ABC transport system permease protein
MDTRAPGEWLYRRLLGVYPRPFRDRFGDELIRCYRLDRARPRFRGVSGTLRFWTHTLIDLVKTATIERRRKRPRFRKGAPMSNLFHELRLAIRSGWRNGRVSFVAALTLALGIGASTAILSVTKGVLLDPLPYRDADRLALVWSEMAQSDFTRYPISGPELNDLRARSERFEEFASIWTTTGALVENDEPETVRLALVTWNFPSILGAEPILGRLFEPSEEGAGVEPKILLSEEVWRRRFGSAPGVLGRAIRVDGGWGFPGGTYTVVGVLPASFQLILPHEAGVATDPDVWVPFGNNLAAQTRTLYYLRTIGRMAKGVTLEQARDEVRAIGQQLQSEYPEYAGKGRAFNVVSLKGDAIGQARPVILALLAGTGLLLVITCANVANLLLSRAAQRRAEMLVRTTLGASGRQIAFQLLVESLVVAALGGLGGLLLGYAALKPLLALAPGSLPRPEAVVADPLVLAVAFGTSLLCGILFGLAPVLASRRLDLHSALRAGARAAGMSGHRGRNLLVVAELALAFLITVGAALCYRTLEKVEHVDLGFDTGGVLSMELTLPRQRYGTGVELAQFTRELERRMKELPGVVAAGAINQLPLSDLPNWSSPYRLRTEEARDAITNEADGRVVTTGYFETIGARLVDGRLFVSGDDENGRLVVVIDDLLAARAWPDRRAVGQELQVEVRTEQGFVPVWAEVVGVVQHMRHHDPRFMVREQFFVPFAQGARNQMALAVRGTGDPGELAEPVRTEIASIDKDLAITNVRPLEDYVRDARAVQRFTMVLATGFAVMALVLGSLGLYAVVAYSVNSRRREIGLRVALGATSAGVIGWVLRQGAGLVAGGIALGLAGSLAIGRFLEQILFGVAPSDPLTLTAVPLVLVVVAFAASFLPASRATRIDPAEVLRQE